MEMKQTPASGLEQITAALRRQLADTRQQLVSLHSLQLKKQNILRLGQEILNQHSTSSWGNQSPTLLPLLEASLISATPCPSGWEIAVHISTTDSLHSISAAVTVIHPSISCSVIQLAPCGAQRTNDSGVADGLQRADGSGLVARARVELQGPFHSFGESIEDTNADIYVIVASIEGVPYGTVYAGRLPLDLSAWLHSLTQHAQQQAGGARAWCHSGHFHLTIETGPSNSSTSFIEERNLRSCLEDVLCKDLGCSEAPLGAAEQTELKNSTIIWSLGSSAKVSYQMYTLRECHVCTLSIYADTEQLMWGLKEQIQQHLKRRCAEEANSSGAAAGMPRWQYIPGAHVRDVQTNAAVVSGLDALFEELEALMAWVEALEQQQQQEQDGLGDALQKKRREVLKVQSAALEATMRTDRVAAVALAYQAT